MFYAVNIELNGRGARDFSVGVDPSAPQCGVDQTYSSRFSPRTRDQDSVFDTISSRVDAQGTANNKKAIDNNGGE